MLKLAKRSDLTAYPFASYVCGSLQKALYDEEYADDKDYTACFDLIGTASDVSYGSTGSLLLSLNESSLMTYEQRLPVAVTSFFQALGCNVLTTTLVLNTDWGLQKSSYEPAREALKILSGITGKQFTGILLSDYTDHSKLVVSLFRLTRYCASLPQILSVWEEGRTVFSICKYGTLHAECYDKHIQKKVTAAAEAAGFSVITDEHDFNDDSLNNRKLLL